VTCGAENYIKLSNNTLHYCYQAIYEFENCIDSELHYWYRACASKEIENIYNMVADIIDVPEEGTKNEAILAQVIDEILQ